MKHLVKNLDKLSERVIEINLFEEKELAEEIKSTLCEYLDKHNDTFAVTSNQFGFDKRAFAIRFADETRVFFNPIIMKQEGLHISRETNASLPGRQFLMPRSDKIVIAYQTPFGQSEEYTAEGVIAELIQQQIQLLDGMLLTDIGLEIFDDFDQATEEEKQEVIDAYLESLKKQTEDLNNEIESDPELKDRADAIRFLTAAAKGEVKLYSQYEREQYESLSNRKKRLIHKLAVKAKNAGRIFTKSKKHKKK